ncbi:MAG: sulfotransferase [Anaerolineales bacterium]|nr:sulfotransferase [Anaerolineales bacterium]
MMLPNFLIIGSQKAGTTSLYHVLREHPQVFMPAQKEVNYFFLQATYDQGVEEYQRNFADANSGHLAVGEASPGYICHPIAPSRIQRLLPGVKLILTVRHPVERAYSQYWDNRRSLSEYHTFEQAVEISLESTYHPDRLGYFSRGTYIQYIRRYLDLFARENLLVLVFEDLILSPELFYRQVFEFLGVDPDFYSPEMTEKFNPAAVWENPVYQWFFRKPLRTKHLPAKLRQLTFYGARTPWQYPPMRADTRQILLDFYRPWNEELAEFLGRDLSNWND